MKSRYYSATEINAPTARLANHEAHHLLHVMRAQVGDEVILFDGSGVEFSARICAHSRSEVTLEILSKATVNRERAIPLELAVALPKGDRQKFLIEKCVELGVTRLVPLETERSVAQPTDSAIKRLQRAVIEASKQCGRNRLMEISSAESFPQHLQRVAEQSLRIIAHPSGEDCLQDLTSRPYTNATVAIGPEGGFSDVEVAQATDRGWSIASLGPRILRIETAAITCAAQFG